VKDVAPALLEDIVVVALALLEKAMALMLLEEVEVPSHSTIDGCGTDATREGRDTGTVGRGQGVDATGGILR
jgi:hypothetical protein